MRKIMSVRFRVFPLAGLCLILLSALFVEAGAQAFTKADSGWVRLFNGNDFTGLYSRTYNVSGVNAPLVVPPAAPYSIEFAGTDTATIRVGSANPQGNIGTIDSSFSHYRMRVEAKFDVFGTTNAGLTYHTRELPIRMHNNWPRSIEFQFKQDQTGDAFSIQQVTFDIRGNSATYSPTCTAQTGCEFGCNRRSFNANPRISTRAAPTGTETRWLNYLLIARGADSATHIVQDSVVLALSNIRIFNDCTKATGSNNSGSSSPSNCTPNGPHGHGALGLQAEGTTLRYRRWEIMQFPASTPKNAPYLHRLFLDTVGNNGTVGSNSPTPIRWRSLGAFSWVKIEYRIGNGSWKTVADSAPNTGSFTWTPPPASAWYQTLPKAASTWDSLRVRVSGPDYVWADSVRGMIGEGTSILPRYLQGKLSFSIPGRSTVLAGLSAGTRLEIQDVSGRLVRSLSLGEDNLAWDLTDSRGFRVPPGMYFVRALAGTTVYRTGRVMVF